MLISVIMPAYNAEKHIATSIDSVLAQTYTDWELIIVDDGSTDNTSAIVKEYVNTDERIKYIYQNNGKQAKARNKAIKNAKGDILAFLDSDDLWLPEKLEEAISILESTEFNMVCTDAWVVYGEIVYDKTIRMNIEERDYEGIDAFHYFLISNRVCTSTVVLQRSVLDEIGGFDENQLITPAEDYDLWLRILYAGYKIRSVSSPLSIYRMHEASSTTNDHAATISASVVVLKNLKGAQLPLNKFVSVRKNWIQRLVLRLDKGEDPKIVYGLVKKFFPGDYIFPWFLNFRTLVSPKFFYRVLSRYSKSRRGTNIGKIRL
jgi:teichuronic acid biosynthesis glycosyltransferase TuaG